jgi:hypothetical protein
MLKDTCLFASVPVVTAKKKKKKKKKKGIELGT